ncbi:MAG: GGDEF domain-containing protein [Gammaproteobacteria bacterium]|nr:GGDEF domain-containing protein [Gammaproteobacteria bacterium]
MSGTKGNKLFLTFVPVAGIAATYFSMPLLSGIHADIQEKLPYIPYLVIFSVMTMGGFFNKHRVTLISAALGIAYLIVHSIISEPEISESGKTIIALVSILLPLNIVFITSLKEQQLLSIQSFMTISIMLLQLLLSYWAIQNYPQILASAALFTPETLSKILPESISLSTVIAFSLSFLIIVIYVAKNTTVFEFSFAGALVSILFYFQSGMHSPADAMFIVTASLIMAWGLVHNSYLIAYIDELTELPGRRAMNEETSRLRGLYSIAMLDIDHFKKFNDTYGHEVGDQVLRMVASKIGNVGGGGKSFRYGGEEFAIIFSGKDSKASFPYLSNLRETIDHTKLILRNQDRPSQKPDKTPPRKIPWQEVHVTISIGVADSGDELNTTDEILKAADDALYRSKEKGRNRISQYSTRDYAPDLASDGNE